MSELLTDTRKYIEQAEHADVESLRQFLLTTPERPLIAMGHGEGAAVSWINTNHAVSDVHSILILQRCTDKQEFRVAEGFVRERVGLIRSHDTAQATVGSVEQCCIRG